MKNLILMMLVAWGAATHAQVSNYMFVKETGQPMDITAYPDIVITEHVLSTNQVLPAKIPLGFPFMFNGVVYDSVVINENGYLWFGTEQVGLLSGVTKPVSAPLSAKVKGVICGLCEDLHPQVVSGFTTIKSGVTGTNGMEELIVQWSNISRAAAINDTAGEDTITFQIKLYHFMNRIEVAYGHFGLNPNVKTEVEVGLRGSLAGDFNNRMTDPTHGWNNSLKGTGSNSVCTVESGFQPTYGDMYVWMNLNQGDVAGVERNMINVFPVPAASEFFVETPITEFAEVELRDISGRVVKSVPVVSEHTKVNLDDVQPGFYNLVLKSKSKTVIGRRVVISR